MIEKRREGGERPISVLHCHRLLQLCDQMECSNGVGKLAPPYIGMFLMALLTAAVFNMFVMMKLFGI